MADNSGTKLSHKQYKALLKKQKRRKQRQATARLQEELEANALPPEPIAAEEASRQDEQEQERQRQEEEDRKQAHDAWLERERQAQEEFEVKRKKEESRKQKLLQEQQRIQEEWEARQQAENQTSNKKEKELEDILQQLDQEITQEASQPTHNPEAPRQAQPAKRDVCPFYQKTGGCRFGDRCSRAHPLPEVSTTLLLPHMYVDFTMEQSHRDEYDTDMGLEYDEGDAYQRFLEFYEDVLPEFKEIGTLVQFKVCCNWEPHLRGNVYVQFKTEEDSSRAREMFHGRFYAGKQLSCVFTPVASWKAAICGMFHQNKCSRGKNCNFLHVFINPRHEFADADRDFKTTNRYSDQSQRGWRYGNDRNGRDQRSRSRERRRHRDRHRRSRSPTWDKRRSTDRRSRERDRHRSIRSRRSRSRDRSRADRSRSLSRSRSRSPTKSRRHRSRSRSRSRRKLSRSPSPSRHHRSRRSRSRHRKSRSRSHSRSRSPSFDRSSIYGMSRKHKSKEHQESSPDNDEVSKSRNKKSSKKLKKRKHNSTKEEATVKLEHIDGINQESDDTRSPVHEASRPEKTVEQIVAKKEHDVENTPASSRITPAKVETVDSTSSCAAMATGDVQHPPIVREESVSRRCSDGESEDSSESLAEKISRCSSHERQVHVETRPKSHKKKRKHKKHKHKKDRSSPTQSLER